MLNAKNVPTPKGKFVQRDTLDTGSYPARIVRIMVMGLQDQGEYKGEKKPARIELAITYELLDEFLLDENGNPDETKPRWFKEVMPFYNLKADKATSTKRYIALDPTEQFEGDWSKLINTPCMVSIVKEKWKDQETNEDRFKNTISNVSTMRPKEASKAPDLVNEPFVFDFYSPDMTLWPKFSNWLQERLKYALDFEGSELQKELRNYKPAPKEDTSVKTKPVLTDEEKTDDEIPW